MKVVCEVFEKRRPYIDKGKIPLGLTSEGKLIWKIAPKISDSMVISAMPGRGKSVLLKNLYWFLSTFRPGVIFDWEGEDHKLSHYANSNPMNLPPGMISAAVPDSLFFVYGEGTRYEKKVKPNLFRYDVDELEAVGFSTAASLDLKKIIKDYASKYNFKNIDDLINFIRAYPTNNWEGSNLLKKKDGQKSHPALRFYKEGDAIGQMVKLGMVKILENLNSRDVFRLDDKEDIDLIPLLRQGKKAFFNFKGDIGLARVEVMRKMDQIIQYRKAYPDEIAPFVVFEEADALFPKVFKDSERPLVFKGLYYLLRGRKFGIAQYYCCPSLDNLHPKIFGACNEKILGQMEGKDIAALSELTKNDYLISVIHNLRFNRYSFKIGDLEPGERWFVYMDEFKRIFLFKPFECPQEIHREGGAHKQTAG